MKFSNLPISRKLAAGFGTVLAVIAISSIVTVTQVRQVAEIERVNSVSSNAQDDFDQARGDLEAARAAVRKLTLTGASQDKAKAETNLASMRDRFARVRDVLSKDNPAFLPDLTDYEAKINAYVKNALDPEISLSVDAATRPQATAMVASAASGPFSAAVDEAYGALSKKIGHWSDEWTAQGFAAMDCIEQVVIASSLGSILIGAFMAWLIGRIINRPLNGMTDTMSRLAAGDHEVQVAGLQQGDEVGRIARAVQVFKDAAIAKLRLEAEAAAVRQAADNARATTEAERAETARQQEGVVQSLAGGLEQLAEGNLVHRIERAFPSEYEKLRTDYNGAMIKLQAAIEVVATNTAAIRSGAGEIATASDDLARRTEQQAASLEQTAAALDEITATVKKTSEGAVHARQLVAQAKDGAEHSGEVVQRAVAAMGAIETSARKVSQIIGVIDEIAFQTNLLALNAGVEAARAGEAGRGFAVVASEVRGLAQRSAEAAKEIKALISASERQVEEGVQLVGETGTALSASWPRSATSTRSWPTSRPARRSRRPRFRRSTRPSIRWIR